MKINSLMNNTIQNNSNIQQPKSFKGVEKVVQTATDTINTKPPKKDGIIVRMLNKYFHLNEHIAKGVAALSQTEASKWIVNGTRKFKSAPARWCDFESFAVTFFYMWNTWKSEKVDEERKVPSMIQNGAVTIASSAAAALVDAAFDPIIDKIGMKYLELEKTNPGLIKEIGGRSAKDFYDAIKKLKSNTVFTAVVRFIIPVLMVPVVGRIVAKLNEKKKEQEEELNKQNVINTKPNINSENKFKALFQNVIDTKPNNNGENKFKALFA